MIELTTKAENYAAEKTNEVMTKAIAQAYADGYRDGYKDREKEIPVNLRDNKTEYVDLGLPSGTLWAKTFEKLDGERLFLPYEKAKKMNLPTEEQWNELREVCKWNMESNKIFCIGPNGNILRFVTTGYIEAKEQCVCENQSLFWILNLEDKGDEKKVGRVFYWNGIKIYTSELFSGYKLPIRLVRSK